MTDIRHRFMLGGSVNTKWNIRLSPFVTVMSGQPFNITSGTDLYGTTLFNGRPGFATDPDKPGLLQTPYGPLDPNPSPGETLVPRNYGRGPAQFMVNLRLSKTFGFGAEKEGSAGPPGGGRMGGGPGHGHGPGPGMGGGIFGNPSTNRRYNLTISLSARNLLNYNNTGGWSSSSASPFSRRA